MDFPTTNSTARTRIHGTLVLPEEVVPGGVLAVEGSRIAYAGPAGQFPAAGGELEDFEPVAGVPQDALILPGLVDLHCHLPPAPDPGASPEQARHQAQLVDRLHRAGTTTLLATTWPAPPEVMERNLAELAGLARRGLIAGIHAEGPFLSPAQPGNLDADHFRRPDPGLAEALINASDGELITMTFAPELPGAEALVEQLASRGVTPSLGHTQATAGQVAAALAFALEEMDSAGFDGYTARPTVTHLFAAMDGGRAAYSSGPAAACLQAARGGRAVVELASGTLSPDPAILPAVFELAGAANIALVGSPEAGGTETAGFTMLDAVRSAVQAGVGLVDAVRAASSVPAEVLRLMDEVGSLHRGLRADAVVVSAGLEPAGVMRAGQWVQPIVPV